ncbi:TonB-dependent receptor [Niveispirillum sp. BGYR6]|uniref:TonB-dependent receptor plug domain-containing protein n=1 Tax=Niveispirillum sp. BGYR6 TaxID=2971249 RepID=UPI0022B97C5A|nr:TonB-dependent receptor [Niveispirillum sp. BGYR6]MDG5496078.1 TonB-dependent receptor [Niveispirillum sp. BGYR6]
MSRPSLSLFGPLLLAGLATLPAAAQSAPTTELAELVVSANRLPTEASRVGASVDVIDRAEIDRRQQVQALDLLKRLPGVSISRNGGFGATSTVRLRGSESGMVKVLVDGVEVNDAASTGNEFDFNSLLTGDIEKIEVLKGPQSALYGNDAMGGVINIITRQGSGAPRVTALAEAGSYGTFRQQAGISGASNGTSYALNASNLHTDGFSRTFIGPEKDGSDARAVSGKLAVQANEVLRFDVSGGWSWLDSDYDPFGADGAASQEKEMWQGRAAADLSLLDGRFTNNFAASIASTQRDFDEPTGWYMKSTFDSRREALDYQGNLHLGRDVATFGLSVDSETAKTTNTTAFGLEPGIDDKVTTKSAFLQYQAELLDNLTVTAGGRVDDHDAFGSKATYRLTGAYQVPQSGTILRASYGTAHKAPTLYQLYEPSYGNAKLRPEEAKGMDAGIEQPLLDGKVTLGASLFRNLYDNLIGFTSAYVNVAKARTQGVELTFQARPVESLLLSANYTYLDATDRVTGRDLPRRPHHTVNASIDWNVTDALMLGTALRYTGKQLDTASARSATLDSSTVLDATVRWQAWEQVSLFGRIDNVLDADYQEVLNYRAPGRSAYGGVQVRF